MSEPVNVGWITDGPDGTGNKFAPCTLVNAVQDNDGNTLDRILSSMGGGGGADGIKVNTQYSLRDWVLVDDSASVCLNDIVFGNGLFVAVGNGGTILTSDNGQSWEDHSGITTYDLNSITYNGEYFIAVGVNGTIIYSANGEDWSVSVSTVRTNYVSVASDSTVAVIVSTGGTLYKISISGLSSDNITALNITGFKRVRYLNGRFTAVGDNAIIAYSADGTTWTSATVDIRYDNPLSDVAYGNNMYIAIGEYNEYVSSDGVTWNHIIPASNMPKYSCIYTDRFIYCGYEVSYSIDGSVWNNVIDIYDEFNNNTARGLAYDNSNRLYVAVLDNGSIIYKYHDNETVQSLADAVNDITFDTRTYLEDMLALKELLAKFIWSRVSKARFATAPSTDTTSLRFYNDDHNAFHMTIDPAELTYYRWFDGTLTQLFNVVDTTVKVHTATINGDNVDSGTITIIKSGNIKIVRMAAVKLKTSLAKATTIVLASITDNNFKMIGGYSQMGAVTINEGLMGRLEINTNNNIRITNVGSAAIGTSANIQGGFSYI